MDEKDKIIASLRKQLQDANGKISALEQEVALFKNRKEESKQPISISIERIRCITFDKEAQDNLPDHIKAKMKTDRDKTREEDRIEKDFSTIKVE